MRWCALILVCAIIANVKSEPEPKKYKADDKEKDKKTVSPLTDDEKSFLREIEEKFGVKSNVPVESGKNVSNIEVVSTNATQKSSLPAVIAIEIVNDTDSNSKGKRTIDANLGYGYRTNNGYTYTYFGKPSHDKGKFMIYPYSQENSPSHNGHNAEYRSQSSEKHGHGQITTVEIQPSQAFELVSVKDGHYEESTKSSESPQSYTSDAPATHPSTLYTTYNGQELSGLSGHFPSLQSNYFVEPKQLLENPQYQEAGLNQEYLSTNSLDHNRPVVPVLVLRIPSSYLKNPTAELYANLPNNYPMSHYLNNINLQGLVNQYFKKSGYNFAPQVMPYQSPHAASSAITPTVPSTYSSEPQHYSNPHIQPSYTQSEHSGVQYSVVKPVMAKYPSGFTRPKHVSGQTSVHYKRPVQQKYEYSYQHAPQSNTHTQAYYGQSEYQSQQQPTAASYELQNEHAIVNPTAETGTSELGSSHQFTINHETKAISVDYDNVSPSHSPQISEHQSDEKPRYDYSRDTQAEYVPQHSSSSDYNGPTLTQYSASQLNDGYYSQKEQADALSAYPSQATSSEQNYQSYAELSPTQGYEYPKPGDEQSSNSYVLTEGYPSKDHTVATVLPYIYKPLKRPNTAAVQTVSYVTPEPNSSRYQSRYRVMVPQTVFKSQDSEKVTYVNSMPMHYTKTSYYSKGHSSEEQNIGSHYAPQSQHKSPSYPRNYHNYYKRMTRPNNKTGSQRASSHPKKQNDNKSS